MKKIILALIVVFAISCKNETSKKTSTETIEVIDKKDLIVSDTIIIPNQPLWTLNRMMLEEENTTYKGSQVFKMERTSTTETTYVLVNNIPAKYGSIYRASIVVKKGATGNLFGLRIIGDYPNRVDAVFDVKNGFMKEVVDVGDFVDGSASIESLGDGWYKCIVSVEVNADKMKIILGPTSGLRKTTTWEAATSDKPDVYMLPTTLTLEELMN